MAYLNLFAGHGSARPSPTTDGLSSLSSFHCRRVAEIGFCCLKEALQGYWQVALHARYL